MERLTIDEEIARAREVSDKNSDCWVKCRRRLCKDYMQEYEQLTGWLEELKQYKDAEEQGLLPRLPCKPEDTIFVIARSKIYPIKAKNEMRFISGRLHILCESSEYSDFIAYDDLTNTAFLTQEEAEQALKAIEEELTNPAELEKLCNNIEINIEYDKEYVKKVLEDKGETQ